MVDMVTGDQIVGLVKNYVNNVYVRPCYPHYINITISENETIEDSTLSDYIAFIRENYEFSSRFYHQLESLLQLSQKMFTVPEKVTMFLQNYFHQSHPNTIYRCIGIRYVELFLFPSKIEIEYWFRDPNNRTIQYTVTLKENDDFNKMLEDAFNNFCILQNTIGFMFKQFYVNSSVYMVLSQLNCLNLFKIEFDSARNILYAYTDGKQFVYEFQ